MFPSGAKIVLRVSVIFKFEQIFSSNLRIFNDVVTEKFNIQG
jgi:hypothetical protein